MTEGQEKAELIKSALKIVDDLGKMDVDDMDELEKLIEKAHKLKKSRLWKLN